MNPSFELPIVDQQRRRCDFEIKGTKPFASCNHFKRLSRPLQSRFRRLHLPAYTVRVLTKLKQDGARLIASVVWSLNGDIRDVISIGKLVRKHDWPEKIEQMIRTMKKYGGN